MPLPVLLGQDAVAVSTFLIDIRFGDDRVRIGDKTTLASALRENWTRMNLEARHLPFVAALLTLVVAWSGRGVAAQPEVTTADVKRFVDPTTIATGLDYTFSFNSLEDGKLYRHLLGPGWAINESQILFADVPIQRLDPDQGPSQFGIGDTALGWGYVPYENLSSRFTSVILVAEVRAPTGDAEIGLGTGGWVLAPGVRIALNPTDRFPAFFTVGYLHSLEGEKTEERDGETVLQLRSWEFALTTVHIMPKGFFLSLEPSLLVDGNTEVFSIVVGAGRALTRHFAFSVGYAQFVAGDQTFNRAAVVSLQYLR